MSLLDVARRMDARAMVAAVGIEATAHKAADILLQTAKRNYPVRKDGGASTNSVSRLRVDSKIITLGVRLELRGPLLAQFLITGTKPHTIQPRTASVLHWTQGGEERFARSVHHPGTRANIFNRAAVVHSARPAIIALGLQQSRYAISAMKRQIAG